MSDTAHKPQHLPQGLTATVGVVQEILGEVVATVEGRELFEVVESVRRDMVAFREAATEDDGSAALDRAASRLDELSIEQKTALARAYTLYLQLVNVCENAYRTHRLRERRAQGPPPETEASGIGPLENEPSRTGSANDDSSGEGADREGSAPEPPARAELTFVLTAHPTESRSPENIRLLRRIQDHVVDSLARGVKPRGLDRREIENLLHLAWRVGTHPPEKPSVEDEANHLFSLLTDPILSELVALSRSGHRVLLRTWVGGDKDGHPGVGPEQTEAALGRARKRLLAFVDHTLLPAVREDVGLSARAPLDRALGDLEDALSDLETVADGDGGRLGALTDAMATFQAAYREHCGLDHPAIERLETLLGVFPGLVVPLELREERGRFGADQPIADMMRRLAAIASGGPIDAYARAVVVSMTLEARDLLEAQALADHLMGACEIPVIPLFELPEVLERAPAILEEAWRDERFRRAVTSRGAVEVMLGYSDTAKRMGMLASRVALQDAMRRIGEWIESVDLVPLFFHGHGSSVGRGGGRIEDLAATWPARARSPYKYTLQGEMVERALATPEILRSLVQKVAEVQARPPVHSRAGRLAHDLARAADESFRARVDSEPFRRLLERATPYGRLQTLTIGSRPARRGGGGLEELRAIPWVLCWTQTRLLLHAWLGVGEAWRVLRDDPEIESQLDEARETDPLFRSFARLLSFTLAKAAPAVWRRYRRALATEAPEDLLEALDDDYDAALDLARRAIGGDSLLPDRPWLEESIRYRAPMIHPLNLLQIDLLGRPSWSEAEVRLFRETVTGIAAGMLTTG